MRAFAALFLLGVSAIAQAADDVIPRKCGVSKGLEAIATAEKHFLANKISAIHMLSAKMSPSKEAAMRASLNGTIPVVFHVVSANKTIEGGYVSDKQITEQIKVLNDGYSATGLTFILQNTTHTINQTLFGGVGPGNDLQTQMKNELRVGGADTLNVYTVGFRTGDAAGLLGYATFPSDYKNDPKDDGVVILYSSLPGGTSLNYNEGKTLTHEAGHWVGLYHTFEGGCDSVGDGVSDTAPEASPASGCPIGRDTCPGGDVDPIHNFMDYSYDACLDSFSQGQIKRLQDQLATYRGVKF